MRIALTRLHNFLAKAQHEVRTVRRQLALRHYLSPLGQRRVHTREIVVAMLLAVDQLKHFSPFLRPFTSQLGLRIKQNQTSQ